MNADQQNDDRLWNEALQHLLELKARPQDPAVQARVAQWRRQSPAHEAAWAEAGQVWQVTGPQTIKRNAIGGPWLTRRRLVAGLGTAAAAGVALAVGPGLMLRARADHVTGTGEIRRVDLPDGSVATLGPDTAIGLNFTASARNAALLSGMAYFDVRPAQAPFAVSCDAMTVTALGTAFELSHDASLLTATVDHGRVAVTLPRGPANKLTLEAGDWVSFDETDNATSTGKRDAEHRALWRRGLIVAEREPVAAVVAKVARWYDGKIVTAPGFSERRISGIFDLRDPVAALEAIVAPFDGKVRRMSPWLVVLSTV